MGRDGQQQLGSRVAHGQLVAVHEQAVGGVLVARARPGAADAVRLGALAQRRVHPLRARGARVARVLGSAAREQRAHSQGSCLHTASARVDKLRAALEGLSTLARSLGGHTTKPDLCSCCACAQAAVLTGTKPQREAR
jgi:hypothetical protein